MGGSTRWRLEPGNGDPLPLLHSIEIKPGAFLCVAGFGDWQPYSGQYELMAKHTLNDGIAKLPAALRRHLEKSRILAYCGRGMGACDRL